MNKYFTLKPGALSYGLLLLLLLILTLQTHAQTYVNHAASGNNDGTSWENAYTKLGDALDNYSIGDEIWVAAGIYLPQEPSAWPGTPRNTFYIYQDVALYGGFDGTETMLSERDPAANVTILSGDLNGDDVDDDFEANREDNVLNVMLIDTLTTAATLIDGFTFQGGHADIDDDYFPNKRGGGIFTWGATQIRNCIFQQNYTIWHAGGVYFWQEGASGGRVENCIFRNNKCLNSGAGIFAALILGEELVIENCQFSNNEANGCGGAFLLNSFASVNNCQFTNNRAISGGGIRFALTDEEGAGNQHVSLNACDFQGNSAGSTGGAIYYGSFSNSSGNSLTIRNCEVTENSSANGGGFWYFSEGTSDGNLTIESCNFTNNEAVATSEDSVPDAAGLGFQYSTLTPSQNDTIRVIDCLIQDNATEGVTGGLFYIHSAGVDNHLQVDNCEIIGNSEGSGLSVGGMAVAEGGESTSVLVRNTLFDGNSGPLFQGFGVGALDFVAPPAERSIDLVNCLFTRHNAGTVVVGTYRAFTLTNCTFANNQGPLLGTIDNGTISLKNNILQSIDFPAYITISGNPKNTFYLYQNVKLYGGFNGTETMLSQRDPAAHETILSGDLNGDDLPGDFETNREDNVINVMYLTEDITPLTVIDGFTVANGHADGDETALYNQRAGGIWSLGSPQIVQCRFEQNYALTFGGGLYLRDAASAEAVVTNCIFDGNRCESAGGGMIIAVFSSSGVVQVNNCQFIENTAGVNGGGLYNSSSSSTISNCHFLGNESGNAGGGMHFANNSVAELEVTVIDCVFENNASNHGGAFYHFSSGPGGDNFLFDHCSFIENEAITSPNPDFFFPDGGAMGFQYAVGGNPTNDSIMIRACIFERNTAERLGGGIAYFNSAGTDNYFTVEACEFTGNSATGSGGAISFNQSNLGETPTDTQWNLVDNDFNDNTAANGGAVAFVGNAGANSEYLIAGCNFDGNEANDTPDDYIPAGGAIFVQFSGDEFQNNYFLVEDCDLENNTADFGGGGLFYYGPFGSDNLFEVNDCVVSRNSAPTAGGLAIIEGGANNTALVSKTFFSQNESAMSMAAGVGRDVINPGIPVAVNPYTEFINCLFANHNDDSGSAVVVEVFGDGVEGTLTNCTLAGNDGTTLGTDVSFPGGQINLRNNILSNGDNPGYMSGSQGNTGTVTSLGGNLVTDATLDDILNGTDQSSTDPLFASGLILLSANSPAVDDGILPDNPTPTDFYGNARLQGSCIDIGAAESPYDAGTECLLTSTREVLDRSSSLIVYPNPVIEVVNISLENEWDGTLEISLINALGQTVWVKEVEKTGSFLDASLDIQQLPDGIYRLILSNGSSVVSESLVKQSK